VLTPLSPNSGKPIGSIRFMADGAALGPGVVLNDGTASVTVALAHGSHLIEAEYPGDGNFIGVTNSLSPNEVVNTPPIASTNFLTAYENSAASIATSLLATSCSDADADTLSITTVASSSARGGLVTVSGASVIYTPPTNYVGSDDFNYTITDSFGATGTGKVLVTINSADVTLSISLQASGDIKVTGVGVPSRMYALQASNELVDWVDIQTAAASAAGRIEFIVPQAADKPMRFYRTAAR
jgi:hypothetical protein